MWWTELLWRTSRWRAQILSAPPSSFSDQMEGSFSWSESRSLFCPLIDRAQQVRWLVEPILTVYKGRTELIHAHTSSPQSARGENQEPKSHLIHHSTEKHELLPINTPNQSTIAGETDQIPPSQQGTFSELWLYVLAMFFRRYVQAFLQYGSKVYFSCIFS